MTENDIKARVRELASMQKKADDIHLTVMLEIGKLVQDVQEFRKYMARHSAETEVSRALRGAGNLMAGERYVRACWQFAFKLSDAQRKKCLKFQLSASDMIALCNMSASRIETILGQIRRGELRPQYATNGVHTYAIRRIENPSRVGKKEAFHEKIGTGLREHRDPSVVSARVIRHGELDRDALTDLLTNVCQRFPDAVLDCFEMAKKRAGLIAPSRKAG